MWAAQTITLTWVRHAQSTANAAGIIDSTVPGPGLTDLGDVQAVAIAEALAPNAYDGIYVSDMIRTQLTAAPMAAERGMTPDMLGGVREISAGIFFSNRAIATPTPHIMDVSATVLKLLGVSLPGDLDGRPLL